MRPLAGWLTTLSLMCNLTVPVQAEDGAKGLFFEQLDHPTTHINTGVQYWIELRRGSVVSEANNKTQFQSGDKIRFHVTPNINGYAYILLKSGSQGEQAQLFPDAKSKQNNHIVRGKEIVLPQDGVLTFDANPGTEKLSLVVSRHTINSDAYLSKENSAPRIAMSSTGSKDLIPNQVLVSYMSPATQSNHESKPGKTDVKSASTNKVQEETKVAHSTGTKMVKLKSLEDTAKIAYQNAPEPKPAAQPAAESAAKPAKHAANAAKHPGKKPSAAAHDKPLASRPNVVTVVNTDPNAVFVADILLEHL